jgi:hypothetical protein
MNMFVAKPCLNNNQGRKIFKTKKEAAKYLEEYTGIEMSYERDKKTKEITYDWELIGKLFPGEA